jgi:hypothetical protein
MMMMSSLSGRELLLKVLYQQSGDRIPVSPFIHVNYVKEFYGTHDIDWVEKTPDVYRHFGFDVMHRNCTPVYEAYGPEAPEWRIDVHIEPDGRDETRTTLIHTPEGTLRCVQATRWTYEWDTEDSPVEFFIKTEADLDLFIKYQPPPSPTDTRDIRRAQAATGEDGVTAPWIQGAFNLIAYYYRKLDDLLVDALTNPDFYHRLMRWGLERYKNHLEWMIAAQPDVISMGGNIANGKLVGPSFFRQYIWSYEKELIEFIQSRGVVSLYHNCGYARKLLPQYPSLEMRAYESLTPEPHGDTVLSEAVEQFGGRTTLIGNIDQIDLLRNGTPAEIEAEIRQVLDTVRNRTPFILATTDYFNDNTPHDHIHVLAEAGHKYGYC